MLQKINLNFLNDLDYSCEPSGPHVWVEVRKGEYGSFVGEIFSGPAQNKIG